MKQKMSISIEESTVKKIDALVREGTFRSKSHAIEYSVNKVIGEKNG